MTEELELRPLRVSDEEGLVAAWNDVFQGQREARSLEHLHWEIRGNPLGGRSRRVVVASRHERVVAHGAGRPARTWINGREHVFTHVGDVFVRPEERRGLAREGVALRTVRELLARCRDEGDALVYGWPIPAHARLGRQTLGYEKVLSQLVLAQPLGRPRALSEDVHLIHDFGEDARWLWERCAADWGASTVRDEAWLRWRYRSRPGVRYTSLGVTDDTGLLRGLCVLAPSAFLGSSIRPIADWLVPSEEVEVGQALLWAAESVAREQNAEGLALFLPAWSPWFATLQAQGWRVHPTELELYMRPFHPRFDAAFLREQWWYQLGDGDLV